MHVIAFESGRSYCPVTDGIVTFFFFEDGKCYCPVADGIATMDGRYQCQVADGIATAGWVMDTWWMLLPRWQME